MVSCILPMKLRWMSRPFDPVPSLDTAEFTADSAAGDRVQARRVDRGQVGRSPGERAAAGGQVDMVHVDGLGRVRIGERADVSARSRRNQVHAPEARAVGGGVDQAPQRDVLVVDRRARRVARRIVHGGQGQALHLPDHVGDRLARRDRQVGDRLAPLQRALHGVERAHLTALVLGDGPDGGIVLGAGDAQAGVDAGQHLVHLGVDRREDLQRLHDADVGVDAVQRHGVDFQSPAAGDGRGRFAHLTVYRDLGYRTVIEPCRTALPSPEVGRALLVEAGDAFRRSAVLKRRL